MTLLVGLLLIIASLTGWSFARPRNGAPRSFVGTSLEVPVTLAIIGGLAVGAVLSVLGISDLRS